MILEFLLGASTALVLFLISLALMLSAIGKGTSRLLAAVSITFLLKLVLIFLALLMVKTLLGEISSNYIWSLVINYLALLLLQVFVVVRRIRKLSDEPEAGNPAAMETVSETEELA